jgi:hypothetical protein
VGVKISGGEESYGSSGVVEKSWVNVANDALENSSELRWYRDYPRVPEWSSSSNGKEEETVVVNDVELRESDATRPCREQIKIYANTACSFEP